MLCELRKAKKQRPWAGLLSIVLVNCAVASWAPIANAQVSHFVKAEGAISGSVFLEANGRPASQVSVRLGSHSAGGFQRVLTNYEGQFEVQGLNPGTYEIVVEEPGYEPARIMTRLEGALAKVVLRLKPSRAAQVPHNEYAVSVRELKIPGKAQSEYEKGLQCIAKKDVAGSLNHFQKATQAFPDYYEAYYRIGAAEIELGKDDEAMQAFEKSEDLSGGRYAWASFGIGYLLARQGKPREAEKALRWGLDVDGSAPNAYVVLGVVLLKLNRPDEAEKSAREALLRKPDFAAAYLVLADVEASRQNCRGQIQNLDAYLKLEPTGAVSAHVRRAREEALKVLLQTNAGQ